MPMEVVCEMPKGHMCTTTLARSSIMKRSDRAMRPFLHWENAYDRPWHAS